MGKDLETSQSREIATLTQLLRRLQDEQRLFQSALDVIRDGIAIIQSDGLIEFMNPRCRELLGVGGSGLHEILWRYSPEIARQVGPAIQNRARVTEDLTISYPERRLIRLCLLPFRVESWDFYALVLSDITAEMSAREEIMETEKFAAIQLLASGVAHEIGNPINTIQIHLQLLQRLLKRSRSKGDMKTHLSICLDELQRLTGIVRCFLKAVNPVKPQLQEVNMGDVIAYCLRTLACEMAELGLKVHLDLPATIPPINGDPDQLEQVLFNLLRNAMDALDGGGNIRLKLHQDDRFLILDLVDDGVGISAADLPHLFDPYFTTKKDGNGLGMMVVQRILRAHGATISVQSSLPRGTRIRIQLPLLEPRLPMLVDESVPSDEKAPKVDNGSYGQGRREWDGPFGRKVTHNEHAYEVEDQSDPGAIDEDAKPSLNA